MILECGRCTVYSCRAGLRDHGPESCPMRHECPVVERLYVDPEIRRISRVATQIEGAGFRRWTRAEEVMEFAKRLGFRKIGLAFCKNMGDIVKKYFDVLKKNNFEPISVGNSDECKPIAQAKMFNDIGTELNVIVGMCVGHDSLFIQNSKAWVTCLVAKDSFLIHNPVGALYGAKGYFSETLYNHQVKKAEQLTNGEIVEQLDRVAKEVAHQGNGRWTRVEETAELAGKLGVTKLGLIFCAGFRREADVLLDILEKNGFEVLSISCKVGAVPKEWIGVLDSEKVQPGKTEMMCNPLAQVDLLNRNQTGLNILMGQCVGHDSLTMKHLRAPTICLIAKDRVLLHNTVAALYENKGLLKSAFYQKHKNKVEKK